MAKPDTDQPLPPAVEPAAYPWWWQRGLMRHLTVIVVVKLVVIVVIKFLFFSAPADPIPSWGSSHQQDDSLSEIPTSRSAP